jgi:hypothetical protein
MAPSRALAALGRLFKRTPPPSPVELLAYAHQVVPSLERAEHLYHEWFEQVSLFVDNEKLANAAAIHRWETATMGQRLARLEAPPLLARPHAELVAALRLASRAAQLLSNGSRFHSAGAVCDGQTLLGASRERRLAAARALQRVLGRYASGPGPGSQEPVGAAAPAP